MSEPPLRNGTPSRRAQAASAYSTSAGSGVPNVGAPDCIDIDDANDPNTTGAPGRTQLHVRHPRHRLGERLGRGAGCGRRRHRSGEDERRHDHRLVRLGVGAGRAEHRRVPHERAVRVDQAHHVRAFLERVGAEHDPRHVDRVARAERVRDRAHERLVRVAHVRVDHVVVPLVDRQVDRLAHRAARVVQERGRVGELHEVPEVLDRAVAAAPVEVAHERGAVGRRKHGGAAPDVHGRPGARTDRTRAARSPGPAGARGRAGTARAHRRPRSRPRRAACARPAASRKSIPTVSRMVSALYSIVARPSSLRTSNGVQRARDERHLLDDLVQALVTPAFAAATAPAAGLGLAHEVLLSRVRRRRGPDAAARSGSATCSPRRGNGSVACGMPIAPTKCSWKRGSVAVSIFSTRRTTSSISVASGAVEQGDPRAGAGGVARARHLARVRNRGRARAPSRGPGRCGRRTRRRGGSGRRGRSRSGPSADGSPRTARPWPAGSGARRSA